MDQIQTLQIEWERNEEHQTQPHQKHKQFGETQPNQKAIEWLETQAQQDEMRAENRQRAKNGEPIVVINHLNSSEHEILSMVEQVLTKNEFSDDSSIFVVVPSVDNDGGNSSHHRNSSVCMQMCEKPVQALKNVDNYFVRDPKEYRNSITNQGVKLSSKGKMYFMEGLPTDMLPYHNKDVLVDRHNPMPKDDCKKKTKNKLCQISTPNKIVERVEENRCNVVSMDTTVDRPCCCSAKANQLSDYNSNNKQVAKVVSNVITPHPDTKGVTGTPCYTIWAKNPRESVRSANLPLAASNTPQSRHHRTQHHSAALPQQFVRAPIQHLTCASTQQYARAFSQQHTRAPIQQLTCAPTRLTWASDQQYAYSCPPQPPLCAPTHLTWASDQYADSCPPQPPPCAPTHLTWASDQYADSCPPLNCDVDCPERSTEAAQQYSEAPPTQEKAEPCPMQHDACPLCQCSPEQLLELFKLAVTGGKLYGIPTICGECPEPETLAPVPPAEPAPGVECIDVAKTDPTCPCEVTPERMQVEMGATKQKRGSSIRQARFSATVGTSTDDKPPRKSGWWSWRKNTCECPKEEPQPAPAPAPELQPRRKSEYDLEPHLTLESYFKEKDSLILSAETLKKNSLEAVRVSGFRLQQEKKPPPEPETPFTAEDAIRYLAMMNPELFQEIVAEQQAKLDGTYKPPPPPPPAQEPAPDAKAEDKEAFKGLKLKVGGKGSGSKGLSGVCCFNLLTESFTTW